MLAVCVVGALSGVMNAALLVGVLTAIMVAQAVADVSTRLVTDPENA